MNLYLEYLLLAFFINLGKNVLGKLKKPEVEELKIHKKILEGYNIDVRPEEEHGVPLHVHFDMKLQKIIKLDVKKQEFVVNTFVRMNWRDPSLSWNISEHEGITEINVGTHLIWTPDVVLYNAANEMSFTHTDVYKTKALVGSNGDVVWTAPVTWRVSCSFDVTWFPIDKQICTLTFGSWSYMETQLTLSLWYDVKNAEQDIEQVMIKNGEWDISDIEITTKRNMFACCRKPFSNILYKITLTRMTLYYFLYIILPLISQIMLFFVIFHIPFESGERMGFGVTIILGITVYLLVISEKLPEKSDTVPMLGMCFIAEFYILTVSLIAAAVIQKMYLKTTPPPEKLRKYFLSSKKYSTKDNPPAGDLVEMVAMHESSGYLHSIDESQQELTKCTRRKLKEDERENNSNWVRICHHLDKICFWLFGSLAIFVPIIIVLCIDKTMMGHP